MLEIQKSNRGKGKYFQKARVGQSKTRLLASKDISMECGENKFYTKNYLVFESQILQLQFYFIDSIEIDTTKY
jgi:hypothetical protein